jgi:hypothetical protein
MNRCTIIPTLMLIGILALAGCGDDGTAPAGGGGQGGVFQGEISDDFEIVLETAIGRGFPLQGPFVIRGRNVRYENDALVVDLSVVNNGVVPHPEPIGLTFIQLLPEGVTLLNPDPGENTNGMSILFQFANDDLMWTPGEESLPRETRFGVDEGVSIAFFARLDIGTDPMGGSIGGVVWHDLDKDGMMDNDEPGLGGIPMLLVTDHQDSLALYPDLLRETVTNPDGSYRFDGLPTGHYVVGKRPGVPCEPTTPDPLHVFLVGDSTGGVSDFLSANFGCVLVEPPPPPVIPEPGDFIEGRGTYSDFAGALITNRIDIIRCDVAYDERCMQTVLRGPITGYSPERNLISIMDSSPMRYMPVDMSIQPDTLFPGVRVEARIVVDEHDDFVIVKLDPWTGEYDSIQGEVQYVHNPPQTRIVEIGAVGARLLLLPMTTP